jgi:hypothetical protein
MERLKRREREYLIHKKQILSAAEGVHSILLGPDWKGPWEGFTHNQHLFAWNPDIWQLERR